MESKIRIPHVAKGTKAEECIMRAVKAKGGLQNWSLEEEIFLDKAELEWESDESFNYHLAHEWSWSGPRRAPLNFFNETYSLVILLLNMELIEFRKKYYRSIEDIFNKGDNVPKSMYDNARDHHSIWLRLEYFFEKEPEPDLYIEECRDYAHKLFKARHGQYIFSPLEEMPQKSGRGLKEKPFFSNIDEERRNKEFFVNFLSKYGFPYWFKNDMKSETNLAFICFCKHLGIRKIESAPACYRFLTNVCGLTPPPSQSKDRPEHQWSKNFKKEYSDARNFPGYDTMMEKMAEYFESHPIDNSDPF